jgi:predicted Zn-dependent protease
MSLERITEALEARAPGAWEIYRKEGASREIVRSGLERTESSRTEEGFAARWWDPAPRFAAAGSGEDLLRALASAAEAAAVPAPVPQWPRGAAPAPADVQAVEPPPDLFEELSRLLSAESRGEASLTELSVRRGASRERVVNAGGLDVSWSTPLQTGFAGAVGRRGARACEARAPFRWENGPDLPALARRLSDRATLPLSERPTPVERGEWLLDVSVAAALLAGLAPLFSGDGHPPWAARAAILPAEISIVDDARADAPFDGEGTASRRVVLVEQGVARGRLHDLVSARMAGATSTGHGVRRSYRTPPARAARRLFFETPQPAASRDLLASVRRGLFASALTAPFSCDLENDRYEAQFTGIAVVAGRAVGPVAAARARGRLSELLRRVAAISPDPQFFPMPDLVGGATILIERASFD